MAEKFYTPAVKAAARHLGVELDRVTGTGAGGRVTLADVRAAAPFRPPLAAVTGSGVVTGVQIEQRSAFDATKVVTIDPYGRNPLADDLQQVNPTLFADAARLAPVPTLFDAGGDLPLFTVSGLAPAMLLRLPWQARRPAAQADLESAQQIFDDLAPNGTSEDAVTKAQRAAWRFPNVPGNVGYASRIRSWVLAANRRAGQAVTEQYLAEQQATAQAVAQATAQAQAEMTRRQVVNNAARNGVDLSTTYPPGTGLRGRR